MKRPYCLALFMLFAFFHQAYSQQKCITTQKMQEVFDADPVARARYENMQKMLDEKVKKQLTDPNLKLFKTNAIINIPVVVHVMYGNPNQVTDAIIQRQLDTLNKYYGGAPAGDSLRVYAPFRTSYGRSQIRFCLAQRTPAGQPTTGITRTVNTTFNPDGPGHPSQVVNAWNTNQYLNIWVVNFGGSGTLGYSYLPGTFAPGDQRAGFVVDYRAFGSGAGYLYSTYNQGKTAVHEIGHFFNLQHTWGGGGSNPSCNNDDGCTDTPKTNGPFFGCTSNGPVTNSCSPAAPGVMWQNMMDYANDACMLLFTTQQCTRMENALNFSPDRSGLKTSNGCLPLSAPANDASINAIINPVNGSSVCAPGITPQVTLLNAGSNALTTVRITVTLNGVAQAPFNWVGNLAPNATTNISLPALNLAAGTNTISITTSLPNGAADAVPANDSKAAGITYIISTNLPLVEGFESPAFPPSNWSVINPDNDFTWQRITPGKASTGAMFINNFDVDGSNRIDEFRSASIQTNGATALLMTFDLAHKNYPSAGFHDTLTVLVSSDCGNTYQAVYKKWGTALATAGSNENEYLAPQFSDWRTETITLSGSILAAGNIVVKFRNTSRFGNNIFIDNINIQTPAPRDLQLISIVNPASLNCTNNITPTIEVRNQSQEAITSFKAGIQLDNGSISMQTINMTIAPLATAIVDLASIPVNPGNHIVKIFTADPVSAGGTGDANLLNDTLVKRFAVPGTGTAPITESFITAEFPPANWTTVNPDAGITWTRHGNGKGNAGSAFVNTFNYNGNGQTDLLTMPIASYPNVDSVKLSFDLAASPFRNAGQSMDTLEILVTTDCGNSYTSIYKKWGAALRTVNPAQSTEFYPTQDAQWRNELVDLSQFATQSPVLVVFKMTNNNENNVFIDNINLQTITLPELLKQQGYLVLPTAFSTSFSIWHYQPPVNLRYVNVYNSAGQLVWTKSFGNNADQRLYIDLGTKAAGMYFVRMGYSDKDEVVEKVIKF